MKNLLNNFNSKLHEPKAFWIGILYLFFFIFIVITWYFFGAEAFRATGSKYNNGGHPIFLLFFGIPGLLVLIYALKPKSKLGNLGKFCFNILSIMFR